MTECFIFQQLTQLSQGLRLKRQLWRVKKKLAWTRAWPCQRLQSNGASAWLLQQLVSTNHNRHILTQPLPGWLDCFTVPTSFSWGCQCTSWSPPSWQRSSHWCDKTNQVIDEREYNASWLALLWNTLWIINTIHSQYILWNCREQWRNMSIWGWVEHQPHNSKSNILR